VASHLHVAGPLSPPRPSQAPLPSAQAYHCTKSGTALSRLSTLCKSASALGPHPNLVFLCAQFTLSSPLTPKSPFSSPASSSLTSPSSFVDPPPPQHQFGSIPAADLEICAGLAVHSFKLLFRIEFVWKKHLAAFYFILCRCRLQFILHPFLKFSIDGAFKPISTTTHGSRFPTRFLFIIALFCRARPVVADACLETRLQLSFNQLIVTISDDPSRTLSSVRIALRQGLIRLATSLFHSHMLYALN